MIGADLLFKIKADGSQATAEIKRLNATVSKELRDIDRAASGLKGNMGGLSGAMSMLLNPAALVAGAGLAVGAAFVTMGKQAFDAAAELHDLSQQTGFQVETLSALKNAADTSGSSIQGMSAALGIFQKNMISAANGNEKMSDTFKALKIDTADNELALRQAFAALMKLEPGALQTATAMQLFGRSGKDVLGVLKEMDGDLDGAIDKFDKMGVLIKTETAAAADRFGDEMLVLGKQIGAMAMRIGEFVIPTLRALVAVLRAVGDAAIWASEMMGGSFVDNALNAIKNSSPTMALMYVTANVNRVMDKALGKSKESAPSMGGGGGGGGKAAKDTAAQDAHKALLDSIKNTEEKALSWIEYYTLQTEKEYARREINIATHTENLKDQAKKKLDVVWAALDDEQNALETSGQKQAEILQRKTEILLEKDRAWREYDKETFKLEQDRNKEIENLRKDRIDLLQKIEDAEEDIYQRRIKREDEALQREQKINNDLATAREREVFQEIDAQRRRLVVAATAGLARVKIIAERARLDLDEEDARHNSLMNELNGMESSLRAIATTEAQKLAIEQQFNALREQEKQRHEDANRSIGTGADEDTRAGMFPGGMSPFGTEGMNEFIKSGDIMKGALADLKAIGMDAFSSLAQGMGAMINAWAQGAELGPNAMRKLVSSVLAGVAAQAAVQAIMFTAYGLAALTPWGAAIYGPALPWFKAAALMAAVAGVAAVAGRAIAPSTAASPVASNAAGGGKTTENKIVPIDKNRTGSEGNFHLTIDVRPTDAFIIDTATKNIQQNGKLRLAISNDGQVATP